MEFKITSIKKSRARGFTLVEILIGVAVGGMVLAQACLLWFYSSRSFAAQLNYAQLDQNSLRALDTLTQNIRQCKALTYFSPTKLTFLDFDDRPLTFTFNDNVMVRTKGTVTKTLLKDCLSGSFNIYQRTPMEGTFEHFATTDPSMCKLVEVSWVCGRKLFAGAPSTTESMQSAKIVLRAN